MRRSNRRVNATVGRLALIPAIVITLFVVVFGVFWTVFARSIGAPFVFTLFGIGFVIVAISIGASVITAFVKGTSAAGNEEHATLYRDELSTNEMNEIPRQDRECSFCGTRISASANRCPSCGAGG